MCVYASAHAQVCMCMCVHYVGMCMCVCTSVYTCVFMCVRICTCMCVCVYMCVYVYMLAHAYACGSKGQPYALCFKCLLCCFFFFFLRKGFWLAKCSPRRLGLLISKSQEPSYLWLPGSVLQIRATQAAFLHRFWEFNQGPHAWVASTLSTVWLHHHHHHQSNISILSL